MKKVTLIATTTFGLEGLVAQELKYLGYKDLRTLNGKVEFEANIEDICKVNLWLRCADRILLKMGEFKALSFEELFENTKKLPWSDILPVDAIFPVSKITSVNSKLFSKSDSQAIIKKATVESMKAKHKISIFSETGSLYSIRVQILKDIVTIGIDTSGNSLHKRGYRAQINRAPIKETLAAAMIMLTKWRGGDRVLYDPTCGTGTLLIEAAMIAKNIAPGLKRKFISEEWDIIPNKYWKEAREKALTLEKENVVCKLYGSDIDTDTLRIAKENIELAGFSDCITLEEVELAQIKNKGENGLIVCNPPYGERLSEQDEVEKLYTDMGRVFRGEFENWSYYILTSHEDFEKLFRYKSTKNRKLYNGGLKCYFYQYYAKGKR